MESRFIHFRESVVSLVRVSKDFICPVCQKPDWCLVSVSGDAAICQRIESAIRKGEAGWYHTIDPSKRIAPSTMRCIRLKFDDGPRPDFDRLSREYKANIAPGDIRFLASRLGVTSISLERLHVGLQRDGYYTFPMRDGAGKIVGIQIYTTRGCKFCVKGSRAGQFIPDNRDSQDLLLVSEGTSDCAAGLSLEFDAIGRFNCSHGTDQICRLCRGRSEVVIVADPDDVGLRGARDLSKSLSLYCPSVKVVIPPVKDLRMWLKSGLTHEELQSVIDRTETVVQEVRCG